MRTASRLPGRHGAGRPAGRPGGHCDVVLAGALLPDGWDGLLECLPSNASSASTTTVPTESLLSAGTGGLVFAAWIVVALAGAAVALTRRDG